MSPSVTTEASKTTTVTTFNTVHGEQIPSSEGFQFRRLKFVNEVILMEMEYNYFEGFFQCGTISYKFGQN